MNTLTIAILTQMMNSEYVAVYHQTPRTFTKSKKKRQHFKSNREPYNVNKQIRRRHNIKQPGFDVQRKTPK